MELFRGGLVFKARRLLYHSTLGARVIKKKKKKKKNQSLTFPRHPLAGGGVLHANSLKPRGPGVSYGRGTPEFERHRDCRRWRAWPPPSVTLSVGTSPCPYGIAYRRAYGPFTSGLFAGAGVLRDRVSPSSAGGGHFRIIGIEFVNCSLA